MVVVGFYFGPLVFLGLFAGTIGGIAFLADKKVGSSLQFGDYGLLRKVFAQVLALGLSMGLLLFIIFILPKMPAFWPF